MTAFSVGQGVAMAVGRGLTQAGAGGGGGGADPFFANVISLLHFNGTNGAKTITDQIAGKVWAVENSASLSTTDSLFGSACLLCPTSGSEIAEGATSDSAAGDAFGTGDYTVEQAVKATNTSAERYLLSLFTSGGVARLNIRHNNAGLLRVYYGASLVISGTTALGTSAYRRVAVSRVSGTTRLFLDGVQEGSNWTDSNNYDNTRIGIGNHPSDTYKTFLGRHDEFRATKGVGRYTTTYTPDASAFPDS